MARKKNSNSLAENRKARHDYFIEETIRSRACFSWHRS